MKLQHLHCVIACLLAFALASLRPLARETEEVHMYVATRS